nr:unnamed protein product [Digitaria exilis]
MRSLLAAAAAATAAPTVLRAGAFPPRPPLLSLPLRRVRAAGNMLGAARSASAAAQSRIGGEAEVRASLSGEIHVIVGPMFAGKTTALLRRVQAEAGNGRTVALIKSNKDNRYGLDSVVTHDGTKMACWALSDLSSFHDKLGVEAYDKVDVIGIDEAQFFDDLYDFCCKAADRDGKIVVVAGLDGDYKRKKFGSVLDVVPLADSCCSAGDFILTAGDPGSTKMEAGPAAKRNPAASLTDELIVEILSRLPVRSVCRFKCVSWSWRELISDPVHRKKLPQTLAGLFYTSYNGERFPNSAHHFTNITGKGVPLIIPSFSFLPVPSDDVTLLDSCNGLLLFECRCSGPCPDEHNWYPPFLYVVCNPATEKWVMLPNGTASGENRIARLAFDPAVSSHFHVVQYELDEWVTGVEICSSKTAAWSFKESEWDDDIILYDTGGSVFLNGFMHMATFNERLAVLDMEGKTWRTIPVPSDGEFGCSEPGCIHQSQGRLCFLNGDALEVL